MQPNFWHQHWQDKQIGYHLSEANPLLVKYFEKFTSNKQCTVFIPLCDKTLDIGWLLSWGYKVVGVELSETAVKELFGELHVVPSVEEKEKLET